MTANPFAPGTPEWNAFNRHAAQSVNPYDPFTEPELHAIYAEITEQPTFDEQYLAELDEHRDQAAADDADEFWTARPVLDHVRTFARARRASPWAVLGVALARIITITPPFVTLPPLVGGRASLNLFVALVGTSGAGKGAAESVAAEVLDTDDVDTVGVGSGEGIAHLFMRRVKADIEQHTEAVMLSVAEIDTLTALGDRRGATLLPELRKAWTGERLGFAYADPGKRLPVPAHAYRLCLVAGVQPGRARALLDDQDAGTPQRFLWLPATDPLAPDVAPDEPQPWPWKLPVWWHGHPTGRVVLDVCPAARRLVDGQRLARLRGDANTLDGHALLARLKAAAALAILDGRADVADEDWTLAGHLMRKSDATRADVVDQLRRADAAENRRRGEAEADRAVIVADRVDADAVKRVARVITRKLADAGGWLTHAEFRRAMTSRDREYFDAAIGRLADAGQIEIDESGTRRRYRVAEP